MRTTVAPTSLPRASGELVDVAGRRGRARPRCRPGWAGRRPRTRRTGRRRRTPRCRARRAGGSRGSASCVRRRSRGLEDEHGVGLAVAAEAGQVGERAVRAEDVVGCRCCGPSGRRPGRPGARRGKRSLTRRRGARRRTARPRPARARSRRAGPSPWRRTPGTRRWSGGCGSLASAAVRSRAHRATRVPRRAAGPRPGRLTAGSSDLNKADSKATLAACPAPSLRPGRSGRNPPGRVRCVSAPPRRCGRRPRRRGRSASPVAARGSTGPTRAPWWTSRCGSASCCCPPAPRPRTSSRRSCG